MIYHMKMKAAPQQSPSRQNPPQEIPTHEHPHHPEPAKDPMSPSRHNPVNPKTDDPSASS